MSLWYWIGLLSGAPLWASLGFVLGGFFTGVKRAGERDVEEAALLRALDLIDEAPLAGSPR